MLVIGLIGIKIIVGVAYDVKFCKEPCGSKGMDFFEVQRDPLSRMPVAEEGITERSDVIPLHCKAPRGSEGIFERSEKILLITLQKRVEYGVERCFRTYLEIVLKRT